MTECVTAQRAPIASGDVEIPDGPCLECDGSGWLDDECTDMCCECDGTGIADESSASEIGASGAVTPTPSKTEQTE